MYSVGLLKARGYIPIPYTTMYATHEMGVWQWQRILNETSEYKWYDTEFIFMFTFV